MTKTFALFLETLHIILIKYWSFGVCLQLFPIIFTLMSVLKTVTLFKIHNDEHVQCQALIY
jgi:hypothetical protein